MKIILQLPQVKRQEVSRPSHRSVGLMLGVLGIRFSHMSGWRNVQTAAQQIRRKLEWKASRIVGVDDGTHRLQVSDLAWHVNEEAWHGMTTQQFARYYLMKIGIGHDLTRIALDPKHPRRLASEEEVLALYPELQRAE
jgi:hypothetical protein